MEKINVLIADDVKIFTELIKNIIKVKENIEVLDLAFNGSELYEKIIKLQPDIVFTDNSMPVLNGIDVIDMINNNSSITKKPKFVLVTGDFDIELLKRANKNGVVKIIPKSMITEEEILETIEKCFVNETDLVSNQINTNDFKRKKSFFRELLRI